jgi:antitoxin component of MazEF toxin-antitoxin module
MSTISAKVFQSGNSQAVRLPKGYRFKGKVVRLTPMPGGVLLTDPVDLARRRRALRKLWGSCPALPDTK